MATAMAFLVLGAVMLVVNLTKAERYYKKQLRRAPRFAIAKLDEGELGRIVGHARVHEQELVAPLTGRACVYYIAKVEVRDHGEEWKAVIVEETGVPFVLEDESGRALVDPRGADLALEVDSRATTGLFTDPDKHQQAFLDRHNYKDGGMIFRDKVRFREAIIEVGEKIAVLGAGVREPDPTRSPSGYRDSQPTLLYLMNTGDHPLVISDDPKTTR